MLFKDFWGIGGYQREAEGYLSVEHLLFVSSLMLLMIACALFFGIKNKNGSEKEKNRVLIVSAILIDALEIFKIVFICIRGADPMAWRYGLPLFLCSIQLIALPVAAFSYGRFKEAALDFVFIFGILGAVLGTYGAGNNYASYPVISFDNVMSGLTHTVSGFASLYIPLSGMTSMKKKNILPVFGILSSFCAAAFIANKVVDYNYMFLVRGDGTPYEILYSLVGGSPILYPIGVVLLFLLYIGAFYGVYYLVGVLKGKPRAKDAP